MATEMPQMAMAMEANAMPTPLAGAAALTVRLLARGELGGRLLLGEAGQLDRGERDLYGGAVDGSVGRGLLGLGEGVAHFHHLRMRRARRGHV
jgi:hypothetical protein